MTDDPLARQVVLEAGPPLGRVLAGMIGTLGLRDIVVVGPMTAFGEAWLASVRAEAVRSALPLLAERSTIHLGRTGDEVVEARCRRHAHDIPAWAGPGRMNHASGATKSLIRY